MNENQSEQILEIGRHLVREVECPKLLVHLTAAIKRRMGGHETKPHPAAVKQVE